MSKSFSIDIDVKHYREVSESIARLGSSVARTYDWGKAIAGEGVKGLEEATSTWKNRPVIKAQAIGTGSSLAGQGESTIHVYVDSPSFTFVDKGTGLWGPKHAKYPIVPKTPGGVLAFNSQFSAKSRPGRLRAYVGSSCPPVRFAKAVMHPGIEPRRFSELATARALREGMKRINEEVGRWLAHVKGSTNMTPGPGWKW